VVFQGLQQGMCERRHGGIVPETAAPRECP